MHPPKFFHRMHRKPYGTIKDLVRDINPPYCTNEQYGEVLNTLKQAAPDNDLGHPAHITFDLEGDTNSDYPRDDARSYRLTMRLSKTPSTHRIMTGP